MSRRRPKKSLGVSSRRARFLPRPKIKTQRTLQFSFGEVISVITMDEEKERQNEIKEKLESEGLDPDEFDEDEQEELADLL